MEDTKIKLGIHVDRYPEYMWSFGVCLSRYDKELYLNINVYRWNISIGRMHVGCDDDEYRKTKGSHEAD